jgi:hypothetical protein
MDDGSRWDVASWIAISYLRGAILCDMNDQLDAIPNSIRELLLFKPTPFLASLQRMHASDQIEPSVRTHQRASVPSLPAVANAL